MCICAQWENHILFQGFLCIIQKFQAYSSWRCLGFSLMMFTNPEYYSEDSSYLNIFMEFLITSNNEPDLVLEWILWRLPYSRWIHSTVSQCDMGFIGTTLFYNPPTQTFVFPSLSLRFCRKVKFLLHPNLIVLSTLISLPPPCSHPLPLR